MIYITEYIYSVWVYVCVCIHMLVCIYICNLYYSRTACYPKSQWLQTTYIYEFLWGKNPSTAYLGLLKVYNQGFSPGPLVSSEILTGEGSASKFTPIFGGRIQFLKDSWTKGLSSSSAVGWRPASVSCRHGAEGLFDLVACFIRVCKLTGQQGKNASRMDVPVFYNLITEVASHHLCHIVAVTSPGFRLNKGSALPKNVILRRWRCLKATSETNVILIHIICVCIFS